MTAVRMRSSIWATTSGRTASSLAASCWVEVPSCVGAVSGTTCVSAEAGEASGVSAEAGKTVDSDEVAEPVEADELDEAEPSEPDDSLEPPEPEDSLEPDESPRPRKSRPAAMASSNHEACAGAGAASAAHTRAHAHRAASRACAFWDGRAVRACGALMRLSSRCDEHVSGRAGRWDGCGQGRG